MNQDTRSGQTMRFCLASFCMDFASNIYLVALPYLAMSRGAASMGLGVLGALRGVAYVLGCLAVAWASDRYNRKALIAAGGAGLIVVYLATTQARALSHLSVLMVAWGLSLSLYWPPLFGWLGDSHGQDRLEGATGAVNLSWAIGALVGGLLGGWLYASEGSLAFAWPAVPVLLACMAMLLSPCPHSTPAPPRLTPRVPGTWRTLAAIWLGNLSLCSLLGLMEGVFPGLGKEIGVDAPAFGLLMAVLALGRLPVFVMALSRGGWLHSWRAAMAVQLSAAGMVATVAWTSAHWWLAAVFLVLGVAGGANYYRALFKALEGDGSRGLKSGLHEASLMAGFLLGSLASGAIAEHWGLRAPYVPMALMAVLFVLAQWILVRSAQRAQAKALAGAGAA